LFLLVFGTGLGVLYFETDGFRIENKGPFQELKEEEKASSGKGVEFRAKVVDRKGRERTLEYRSDYLVKRVRLPVYEKGKDAEGSPTSRLQAIIDVREMFPLEDGRIRLVQPVIRIFRQPDWASGERSGSDEEETSENPQVQTVVRAEEGTIEKDFQRGLFQGDVRLRMSDQNVVTSLETERIQVEFEARRFSTDAEVRMRSGRDLQVVGMGFAADLIGRELMIMRQVRAQMIYRKSGRFELPIAGRPYRIEDYRKYGKGFGRPRLIRLECDRSLSMQKDLTMERPGYRLTLQENAHMSRGETLIQGATIHVWFEERMSEESEETNSDDSDLIESDELSGDLEVVKLRVVGQVHLQHAGTRAGGEYFTWELVDDTQRRAIMRHDPWIHYRGQMRGGGPLSVSRDKRSDSDEDSAKEEIDLYVKCRGDMVFDRSLKPLADGSMASEDQASFYDQVNVVFTPAKARRVGSKKSPYGVTRMAAGRIDLQFAPREQVSDEEEAEKEANNPFGRLQGGGGTRVRSLRASEGVVLIGKEGEARGDVLTWEREENLKEKIILSGGKPSLRVHRIQAVSFHDRLPGSESDQSIENREKRVGKKKERRQRRRNSESSDLTLTSVGDIALTRNPDGAGTGMATGQVVCQRIPIGRGGRSVRRGLWSTLSCEDRLLVTFGPGESGGDSKKKSRPLLDELVAIGKVHVQDPQGASESDRLSYLGKEERLVLEGDAHAYSPDGHIEGKRISYDTAAKTLVVIAGMNERAVVWQETDRSKKNRLPEEALLEGTMKNRVEANVIRYDRVRGHVEASGRVSCRVRPRKGSGGDLFRITGASETRKVRPGSRQKTEPWVVKAERLEAFLDTESRRLLSLAGRGAVHVYSFDSKNRVREGRGERFEYDGLREVGKLYGREGKRCELRQDSDLVKSQRMRFDRKNDIVICSGEVEIGFQPPSQNQSNDEEESGSRWEAPFGLDNKAGGKGFVVRQAPVRIQCSGDALFARGRGRLTLTREVRIQQGETEVRAERVQGEFDMKRRALRRIVGTRQVILLHTNHVGRGDQIVWDLQRGIGELVGMPKASLTRGNEYLQAPVFRFEQASGRIVESGGVEMKFQLRKDFDK
jgi:lipopolysaccharide export system protein LptA/lipopolysaccharide export system protein LptC